jgi:hypothetical protein
MLIFLDRKCFEATLPDMTAGSIMPEVPGTPSQIRLFFIPWLVPESVTLELSVLSLLSESVSPSEKDIVSPQ